MAEHGQGVRVMRTAALLFCLVSHVGARPRSSRDWGKMTDKDWEAIEKEWETPEEKEEYEYRPPKQKGIDMEKLKETKDPKKVKVGTPQYV